VCILGSVHIAVMCDKTFSDGRNPKVYRHVHTGERPYCCDVCYKTFSDTINLKEMPLFKIRVCLIGSTFNSVNILSDCVCVCVCVAF
jgi:uncharacterized Zn-finger protein